MPRQLVVALLALALTGCGGGKTAQTAASSSTTGGCTKTTARAHPNGGYAKKKGKLAPAKTYELVFHTNCGSFTVTLDQRQSPNATASLVSLARRGFFTDTFFHRIVPRFVIQGGDPTGSGRGGPGYLTVDKPPATAHYTHGTVAMAKTATQPAGTAGSQFFIVTARDAGLPPDYAIVGKVTAGLDVVDRIGKLGDQNEQPTQAVVVSHVDVHVS